jgi:hypothetical protein
MICGIVYYAIEDGINDIAICAGSKGNNIGTRLDNEIIDTGCGYMLHWVSV